MTKLILIGARIEVGGDEYLIPVAPHFSCQLYADLMTQLGRDLIGLEALVSMVGDVACRLAEPLLYGTHFVKHGNGRAVDARDKARFLRTAGFCFITCIMQDVSQIGIDGLMRIGGNRLSLIAQIFVIPILNLLVIRVEQSVL